MIYRKMEELTKREIELLLQIVCPYSELLYFEKKIGANYIQVYYRTPFDKNNVKQCVEFLPDEVVNESEEEPTPEQLYEYKQFMIARGFSEYWHKNPYII